MPSYDIPIPLPASRQFVTSYVMPQFGTHAARPAAAGLPEGMTYFETDTQLAYQIEGGAWTVVVFGQAPAWVAASDSPVNYKAAAYLSGGDICTGAADQIKINAVLTARKHVLLAPGTFVTSGDITPPSNSILEGPGRNLTTIQLAASSLLISDKDNVKLRGFKVTGTCVGAVWPYPVIVVANADHHGFEFDDIWVTALGGNHFDIYNAAGTLVSDVLYKHCLSDGPDGHGYDLGGVNATSAKRNVRYLFCDAKNVGLAATRIVDGGGICWSNGWNLPEFGNLTDVLLKGCNVSYAWEDCFHQESVAVKNGVRFVDCMGEYAGQKGGTAVYGSAFWISDDTSLINCEGRYCQRHGFSIVTGDLARVLGGRYHHNTLDGGWIESSQNCKVGEATMDLNTRNGLTLYGWAANQVNQSIIGHNHMVGNGGYGTDIAGGLDTNRNTIHGNIMTGNTTANYRDNGTNTLDADNYHP